MPTSPSIQRLFWKEIKSEVATLNKELFDIIEEISPSDRYSVYKVRYPFGVKIVDNGRLHLPSEEGHFYPIANPAFSSELNKELNYATVPLSLILDKSCEIFIENEEQIISLSLLSPKQLFGLFEVLAKQTGTKLLPWSITAGARSLFMLPKITDMNAHRRIVSTYNVQPRPPDSLSDHWKIFTKIAESANEKKSWYCEILIFSEAWVSQQKDNVLWSKFNNYLYAQAWVESAYLRNKTILNLLWEILASSIIKTGFKVKPYAMQTTKQLTAIAYGFAPGYKAAGKNETVAPISVIENAYIHIYELKEYLPIIMYPSNINSALKHAAYYHSLAANTLHEGSFGVTRPTHIISKLREVKQLMGIVHHAISNNPLLQAYLSDDIHYHYYFHNPLLLSQPDFNNLEKKETDIQSSKDIPLLDPSLIETFYTYQNRIFPAASPFIRGCVGITHSKKIINNVQEEKEQRAETVKAFDHAADPVII